MPCYGLAEATLMVTASGRGVSIQNLIVDKTEIEQDKVSLSNHRDTTTKFLVSSGIKLLEQSLKIVNPETLETLTDDHIGEIWVAGKHIAKGYWNKPIISQERLQAKLKNESADFLRTGDLGFYAPRSIIYNRTHQGFN